jgi:large subunit ribosomal protein L17
MRHRVAGRHLKRDSGHRKSLYRNLITELFRHERIMTTEARAKAIRGRAEKLITVAKVGAARQAAGDYDAHQHRLVAAVLTDKSVVKKLFEEIAPRYATRPGGYTRMMKLGPRKGDGADMALLELVE